jgi:hypothetical protein
MKLRHVSAAANTTLRKYHQPDVFLSGKRQAIRNARDVMRGVTGT